MKSVIIRAVFITIGAFGAFLYGYFGTGVPEDQRHILAMSMCFFTLVASELFVVYPSKSDSFMGISRSLFGNRFLNIGTLAAFAVLVAVMYVPLFGELFSVVALSATQIVMCLVLVGITIAGFEISKLSSRK